jgi:hypothetical protein
VTTVIQAILAASPDQRVREAMALGAGLEGGSLGSGPFGVGDHGHSTGPYQINKSNGMHANISDADRLDPVKATAYMLGEYQGAVARVPASVWANDPERAAETAVFLAERPAQDYYVARGADQVDSAWAKAKTGLAGGSVDSPATSGSHGGGGILSGVERGIGAVGGAVAGAVGGAASDAAGSAVSGILSPVV